MSTRNIYFHEEIGKVLIRLLLLSGVTCINYAEIHFYGTNSNLNKYNGEQDLK